MADLISNESAKTRVSEQRSVPNATDPLNLIGVISPGETVHTVRTTTIAYVDGLPETSRSLMEVEVRQGAIGHR